jgi:hypothetical protein
MMATSDRLAALEAEVFSLRAQLAAVEARRPLVARQRPPQRVEEPLVVIGEPVPVFDRLPSASEQRQLIGIVRAKYPELVDAQDTDRFEREFQNSLLALSWLGRSDTLNTKRLVTYHLDNAIDTLHRAGRDSAVSYKPFTAACLCARVISNYRPLSGEVLLMGLAGLHLGKPPLPDKTWRLTLEVGQLPVRTAVVRAMGGSQAPPGIVRQYNLGC